jgi:hypothetical protein
MRDNGMIQKIAEDMMGKNGAPKYPYVLCKRSVLPEMTYDMHSIGEWEGLKPTVQNGRVAYQIDPNFTLIIKPDGTCFIPDTPNNQAKIDRLSHSRVVEETKRRHNSLLGVDEEYTERTTVPALYERVETNLLSGVLVDDLARKVMARAKEMAAEDLEGPEETEIRPHHSATGAVSEEIRKPRIPAAPPVSTDPPKRKGRSTGSLTDPIR